MYKVIFADDEAIYRKFLWHVIDWRAHGFQIVGEAGNGKEALELIKEKQPDIALLDINMPFLNGIDLAAAVKEQFPNTAVVMITGHSEFEYARQALKLNVDDYILKPFDEDELQTALAKVKSKLEKTRQEHNKALKEQTVWRETMLNQLISNEFSENNDLMREQITAYLQQVDGLFQAFAVEIDHLQELEPSAHDIRLFKSIIANLLQDLIKIDGQFYIGNGPENRVILLLQYNKNISGMDYSAVLSKEEEEQTNAALLKLCSLIKRHFGFSVTIGAGSAGLGLACIRSSYKEAVIALSNKMTMQLSDVLYFEEMKQRFANAGFYPSEINEKLMVQLRSHDTVGLEHSLLTIQTHVTSQQLAMAYTQLILSNLVSLALTYIDELGRSTEEMLPEQFSPQDVLEQPSLEAAFGWIRELYITICDKSKQSKHSKSNRLLKQAIAFIQNHYTNSQLKVEDVARHLYIQPRYLLKIFNQELGKSVSDYILELRMEQAKNLLSSGQNLRLTDVAEMSGYNDASHFSKRFKKYTGFSPSEFEVLRSK